MALVVLSRVEQRLDAVWVVLAGANAFAVLTRLSMERNVKLRVIAEEILAEKDRSAR